jgi:hypothetical protein
MSGSGAGHFRRWASTASASQSASASASGRFCGLIAGHLGGRRDRTPLLCGQFFGGVADVIERGIEAKVERVDKIDPHPVLRPQHQPNGFVERVVFGEPPPGLQQTARGSGIIPGPAQIPGIAQRRKMIAPSGASGEIERPESRHRQSRKVTAPPSHPTDRHRDALMVGVMVMMPRVRLPGRAHSSAVERKDDRRSTTADSPSPRR